MSEVLSLFKGVLTVEPPRTMRAIVLEVAERYGLTVDELKGASQAHRIAHPRQEAMWLMRQQRWADGSYRFSLPQIGAFLGGRDHTTALHGVRAHEARIAQREGEAA